MILSTKTRINILGNGVHHIAQTECKIQFKNHNSNNFSTVQSTCTAISFSLVSYSNTDNNRRERTKIPIL